MSDDAAFSSDTGGYLSRVILQTVAELNEEDDTYVGATRGKILMSGVEAGYSPEEVEEELRKQLMKGRIYETKENRYQRV